MCLASLLFLPPWISSAEDGFRKKGVPEGVYIDLTRDFYETLREEGRTTKTYSNDPSSEYLRQIAVSTRFMVETNLQIIRLQEQILRLLEAGSESGKK